MTNTPKGAQFAPEDLHAMTDLERTQLFDRIIAQRYGATRAVDQAAHDLGVSRQTAFRWRRENNVPFMAILLLQEWEKTRAEIEMASNFALVLEFKQLMAQQAELTRQQIEVSKTLERLIVLLNDVPRGS